MSKCYLKTFKSKNKNFFKQYIVGSKMYMDVNKHERYVDTNKSKCTALLLLFYNAPF